jgi:hypothetical protein
MGQASLSPPITTFFTNKIPCTFDDWFDTLVAVASVYDKFDGTEYNRDKITREFGKMATRNETTQRDPSDFRDEYGAYGSCLGIFYVEKTSQNRLVCRVSKAAKELLCSHNPDPEAFCRLQMALYQYPDGTGVVYQPAPHLQQNSADAKMAQIKANVLFAPFRAILLFLLYFYEKQELRREAYLTHDEVYFLFNLPDVYTRNLEAVPRLVKQLVEDRKARRNLPSAPVNFKRNFHILERAGLIKRDVGRVELDAGVRGAKLNAARTIAQLDKYFEDFSALTGSETAIKDGVTDILLSGKWGRYFDGLNLDYDIVSAILNVVEPSPNLLVPVEEAPFPELRKYRLFRFPGSVSQQFEVTPDYARARERREKRNARHREINDVLAKKLINLGCRVSDNGFVDLVANSNGSDFIFEVKTAASTDFLDRAREAIAQLLEYRYRSRRRLSNPRLVLLIEREAPPELAWLKGYLDELGIMMCWMDGNRICAKREYRPILGSIVDDYV